MAQAQLSLASWRRERQACHLRATSLLDLVVFGRQLADTTAKLVKPNSSLVVVSVNGAKLRLYDLTRLGSRRDHGTYKT